MKLTDKNKGTRTVSITIYIMLMAEQLKPIILAFYKKQNCLAFVYRSVIDFSV